MIATPASRRRPHVRAAAQGIAAALLLTGLVTACAGRERAGNTVRDLPAAVRDFSVPADHIRLANGLRVVVSEDHSWPVAAVAVMYRAGFRAETPGRSGLAHLFEHLMFQGTASVDKDDYARTINGLGGRFSGATRSDYASYSTVAPSTALDVLLWIEADRMRRLKLTRETLENQRAVVLEEVRMNVLNQPYGMFETLELPRLAFATWQNGHNTYGEIADLEAASLDDMLAFYRRFYTPGNAVLVVVGDCSAEHVFGRAREYFGSIPAGEALPPVDAREPAQEGERSAVQRDRLARTPALAIGYRLPPRLSRPFLALALVDSLLARDARSALPRALIEDSRLATAVSASFHPLGNDFDFDGPMLYTIRVDYGADRTAAEILAEADRVIGCVQRRVSAEDLATARMRYGVWFLDQVAGSGSPHVSLARLLAAFTMFDGTPNRINEVLPEIMTLTEADLERAARDYLTPSNRVWIERRPE